MYDMYGVWREDTLEPITKEVKEKRVEIEVSEIAEQLMQSEQRALDEQTNCLRRLEAIYEQTGREDVFAFISDFKNKQIADETGHWELCRSWFEYFNKIEPEEIEADIPEDEDEEDGEDEGQDDEFEEEEEEATEEE